MAASQQPAGQTACASHLAARPPSPALRRHIQRLQVLTLAWMLVECAVALSAAWRARSPVLLAFGADSFVELLSAAAVLLPFLPRFRLRERPAARLAGILLWALAAIIAATSLVALTQHLQPETSWMGMGVTVAALLGMPLLTAAKRKASQATGNAALRADAVQSATCAYLAAITLAGLVLNAIFRVLWIDPVAALLALPILALEARRALQGDPCC